MRAARAGTNDATCVPLRAAAPATSRGPSQACDGARRGRPDAAVREAAMKVRRVLLWGARGRSAHLFNLLLRDDPHVDVLGFVVGDRRATTDHVYPAALAGPRYPNGVPLLPEGDVTELVRRLHIDEVWLTSTDATYAQLIAHGDTVLLAGADLRQLPPRAAMLESSRPVIAVSAVRTGAGKSPAARYLARLVRRLGKRVAVARHPMPGGPGAWTACQRFATRDDLALHGAGLEERAEIEPHLALGGKVFTGLDVAEVLACAEREADVIIWEGDDDDTPYLRPDLHIVVADPHRAGDETCYAGGHTNLRLADLVLINKADTADPHAVARVEASVRSENSSARVVRCASRIDTDGLEGLRGADVVVVEDGHSVTAGGLSYGAAYFAARLGGARSLVDPRPAAVGRVRAALEAHPRLQRVVPALGESPADVADLHATLRDVRAAVIVDGTMIDLERLLPPLTKRWVKVRYELDPAAPGVIEGYVRAVVGAPRRGGTPPPGVTEAAA